MSRLEWNESNTQSDRSFGQESGTVIVANMNDNTVTLLDAGRNRNHS
jgi:hypothetical protein